MPFKYHSLRISRHEMKPSEYPNQVVLINTKAISNSRRERERERLEKKERRISHIIELIYLEYIYLFSLNNLV